MESILSPGIEVKIRRMLKKRISQFIADAASDDFESLALQAFEWQCQRIPALRTLCEQRGLEPGEIQSWREVPAVPALAFRSLKLAADPEVEIFRSSGTTSATAAQQERSTHYHPYPDLYREAIEASFPNYCLDSASTSMLALVPDRRQLPDSSLSFMVDYVVERYGDPTSRYAFGTRGLDFSAARSWASARQRSRQPGLILATTFALAQWLERLQRLGLRFRLPPGTTVFETGGYKGKKRELSPSELLAALDEHLGVGAQRVVREYGMTELTSQFYTEVLHGGDADLFVAPHWMRARLLDPETLDEVPAGQTGLLAIFDLANLGSAVHLLSEDLAVAEEGGFRLVGRASQAQLRGCSLTAEELAGPPQTE